MTRVSATDRNHQYRVIFATAKTLGIDADIVRDLNFQVNGLHSLSASSDAQINKLIKALFAKVKKPRSKRSSSYSYSKGKPKASNVIHLITSSQQQLITHFLEKLGWNSNPKRYEGFCQKVIKKPTPRTVSDAQKITEALKDMATRNYGLEISSNNTPEQTPGNR